MTKTSKTPGDFPYHEVVLFIVGLAICVFEVIDAEVLGRPFHYEFLILGAAFCGVSLTLPSGRK